MYHLVFPVKYRKIVFDEKVDEALKSICLEIEKRYQIKFLEIGTDEDHVHFLVQSVPTYSVTKLVTMIKSLTETLHGCRLLDNAGAYCPEQPLSSTNALPKSVSNDS